MSEKNRIEEVLKKFENRLWQVSPIKSWSFEVAPCCECDNPGVVLQLLFNHKNMPGGIQRIMRFSEIEQQDKSGRLSLFAKSLLAPMVDTIEGNFDQDDNPLIS